ncbi:MAG: 16S rRNA (cytidine(1402)-2'-O)-methyltransferase [Magnetococcales bacterium]|nr:16S rRNA (cytidine(1402)-2'-O)-methyltransferase [Magnetococcales bacterium]
MREQASSTGRLYIVPTPIGNLEDITLRALRLLGEVDRILAEDTRRTRILLDHHAIRTPLSHFDDHNAERLIPGIHAALLGGARMALVSDAGTPGISDPGGALVRAVRDTVPVEALPGASAVTTALSGSGLPGERFVFEGFLPRKGAERRARLESLLREERTVSFFESPQRLAATLAELVAMGAGDRGAIVARELTKIHETYHRGTIAELTAHFQAATPRGEIVVLLEGAIFTPPSAEDVGLWLDEALGRGLGVKEAARGVAARSGRSASELYALALARRGGTT